MFIDEKDVGVINHAAYEITQKINNLAGQRVEFWVMQMSKARWRKSSKLSAGKGAFSFMSNAAEVAGRNKTPKDTKLLNTLDK